MLIETNAPLARAAVEAIRSGNVPALKDLLTAHPRLATARLGNTKITRTLLHVVTDWPGHFPRVAATVSPVRGPLRRAAY
jgi:hypothetical protein